MTKKVIVNGLSQSNWEVYFISKIVKELNWKITYWDVNPNIQSFANKIIPNANIVTNNSSQTFKKYNWPLVDEEVIELLSKHELILWPSFLRNAKLSSIRGDLSMKDEYHRAITFRYYFIKHYSPELYLFGNVPTGFYALLDYVLSKIFKFETLILRRTELPGHFVIPITSLEEHSSYIYEELISTNIDLKKTESVINDEVNKYIDNLSGLYEEAMPGEYGRAGGFNEAYKISKKTGKIKIKNSFLKKAIKATFSQKKSKFKFLVKLCIYSIMRANLAYSYSKLVSQNIFEDENYILVNLHYQPEASSIPLGGKYAYQELLISMLSRAVPKGWAVYVKEHPSHLLNNRVEFSMKFRHKTFYENISQYHNVKLISVDENNFKLIDKSKAVATLTGTAGFEAINRGVPCLAFGFPWYMYASGCIDINNFNDLNAAINRIQNGYKPHKAKIIRFVNCILENAIPGMFSVSAMDYKDSKEYGEIRADRFLEIIQKQEII